MMEFLVKSLVRLRSSSQDFLALIIVVTLHLLILWLIFFQKGKEAQSPILSFSVTMMDLASTQNMAISAKSEAAKMKKVELEQKDFVDKQDLLKDELSERKEVKKVEIQENADEDSPNSIQRTIVLAPDEEAVFNAAYLNNSMPAYPALSRRFKEQGLVVLNVVVNEKGKAQSVILNKSSGFARLDEAAINTVKNWRFVAAKQDDKPVVSMVLVPINFILE